MIADMEQRAKMTLSHAAMRQQHNWHPLKEVL